MYGSIFSGQTEEQLRKFKVSNPEYSEHKTKVLPATPVCKLREVKEPAALYLFPFEAYFLREIYILKKAYSGRNEVRSMEGSGQV